jgi:hypothetical protein
MVKMNIDLYTTTSTHKYEKKFKQTLKEKLSFTTRLMQLHMLYATF